jgi:hypothetical protein
VDLTNVASADQNANIQLNLVGVKDGAGNLVSPNPVSVTLTRDTAVKAQANIVSVKRTAKNTLELKFDKALKTAPSVTINSDSPSTGVVSTTDPTVYDVTLTSGEQALTGVQNVSINSFDAYNTAAPVTTAITKIVDFTLDTTAPTVTSTQLVTLNNVKYLVVNFNKAVTSADLAAGTFTGTVSEPNGDLVSTGTVNFTAPTFYNAPLNATTSNSVKINLSTLTQTVGGVTSAYTLVPGAYNVQISSGIAKDSFANSSAQATSTFTVGTSTANLPAPTSVVTKTNTPGVVQVTFANKVDAASAQNVSNYSIEGATITGATLVTNSASGATVELSIAPGTMSFSGAHQVTIQNVKGYADSYAPMNTYSVVKQFTENVASTLVSSNGAQLVATNKIVLSFTKALVDASAGSDFDVYQNGVKVGSTSAVESGDNSKVDIALTSPVSSTSGLVVKAASTIDLADADHNNVVFNDTSVSN